MDENGILEWSFTRKYDVGDGPWPSEDEAAIEYDTENDRITVTGVSVDGDTGWEGCVRRVRYHPGEDELHVDVGAVRTGDELVHGVIQRIHYEVAVRVASRLPARTRLRHLTHVDTVQFETTAERTEESDRR